MPPGDHPDTHREQRDCHVHAQQQHVLVVLAEFRDREVLQRWGRPATGGRGGGGGRTKRGGGVAPPGRGPGGGRPPAPARQQPSAAPPAAGVVRTSARHAEVVVIPVPARRNVVDQGRVVDRSGL